MQISLLGPVEIAGARQLEPRDRLALAVLAVRAGESVAVEDFAEALWPAGYPSSWQKQVQICIGRLRKSLGVGAIQTVPGGYRLVADASSLDTRLFEQLVDQGRRLAVTGDVDRAAAAYTRALALWHDSPFRELDAWLPARSEASRLEELRRTAEEDLTEALLAAGEHREVAVESEILVAAEPLRERRWAQLALAQYRCGRQADALQTLRRAREVLASDVALDGSVGSQRWRPGVSRRAEPSQGGHRRYRVSIDGRSTR